MVAERMTWENMVIKYPNRWVVIKNPIMKGPDIVEGDVLEVKTDEEISEYKSKHRREGLRFRRTTEDSTWDGIVNADFIIETT